MRILAQFCRFCLAVLILGAFAFLVVVAASTALVIGLAVALNTLVNSSRKKQDQ